jgi:hypothetical protein
MSVSTSDLEYPAPTPDQTYASSATLNNICAKSKIKRKLSKVKKGKQPMQQTAIMQANLKHVRRSPILTVDQLREASQHCVELHKYYTQNNKMGEDIMVQFKDHHFLLGDDIFVITFSNLYELFSHDTLDISLMHCFVL